MAMAIICRVPSIQQRVQRIVPDKRATPQLAIQRCEQFRSDFTDQSSPKFKRAMQLCTLPGTSPSQTDFSIFCPEFRIWRWMSRGVQVMSLLANFGKEGSQQPNPSETSA
jgi:hypothetical protein